MNNRFIRFVQYVLSLQLDDQWAAMYTLTQDVENRPELPLQLQELIRRCKKRKLITANAKYLKNGAETKYGLIEFFKTIMTTVNKRTQKADLLNVFLARTEDMLLEILNNWPKKCDWTNFGGKKMETDFFHAGGMAEAKDDGDVTESDPDEHGIKTPERTDKEEDICLSQYVYDSTSETNTDEMEEEKEAQTLPHIADIAGKKMDQITVFVNRMAGIINDFAASIELQHEKEESKSNDAEDVIKTVIKSLTEKFRYIDVDLSTNVKPLEASVATIQPEHKERHYQVSFYDKFVSKRLDMEDDELLTKPIIPVFADVKLAEARARAAVEREQQQVARQIKIGSAGTTIQNVDEKRDDYEQIIGNVPLLLGEVCSDVIFSQSHVEAVPHSEQDKTIQTMKENEEMITVAETSAEIESTEPQEDAMLLEKREQEYQEFAAVTFRQFWRYLNILKEWNLKEFDELILQKILIGHLCLSPTFFSMEQLPEDFFEEDDDTDSSDDDTDSSDDDD